MDSLDSLLKGPSTQGSSFGRRSGASGDVTARPPTSTAPSTSRTSSFGLVASATLSRPAFNTPLSPTSSRGHAQTDLDGMSSDFSSLGVSSSRPRQGSISSNEPGVPLPRSGRRGTGDRPFDRPPSVDSTTASPALQAQRSPNDSDSKLASLATLDRRTSSDFKFNSTALDNVTSLPPKPAGRPAALSLSSLASAPKLSFSESGSEGSITPTSDVRRGGEPAILGSIAPSTTPPALPSPSSTASRGEGGLPAALASPGAQPRREPPLTTCPHCKRKFKRSSYMVHAQACQRVFGEKREQFDSKKARVQGTEAEEFVDTEGKQNEADSDDEEAPRGKPKIVPKKTGDAKTDESRAKAAAEKKKAWKEESAKLREALKQARQTKQFTKAGNTGIDIGKITGHR